MKIKDLRNMTGEELNRKLDDLYDKLLHLRSDIKVGKLQKPHEIGVYRSDIAKIHTLIKERSREKESEV